VGAPEQTQLRQTRGRDAETVVQYSGASGAGVEAFLEIIEHVVASPHGERHKRHGRCFVGATRKDARVTDVKI
jgi:hypothetical protein